MQPMMTRNERKLHAALLELATAAEDVVLEEPHDAFRAALDTAWALVDADGQVRRDLRKQAGCVECGGAIGYDEDLCGPCAESVPELEAP